ncbi:MAG: hypothetical protein A2915_03640 [Candidatus Yanofskybacteria bacterium RIFCSPLOWO2_01_FULL_41_34]|uniref:Uncharacterized protein n=1 Tax=Candidatus Yanofskybacteria bacterium RIFCSPHIGHO2_01_FULL_41_26 TaxID=1802661 RepID=A0A1F8EDU6_9BACT|nr:MAG: hypothetical protein A2649_01535 [Candidatus Yanofskybacteria bacterium RIFCSPHIGHO2_01_FULL_41_26]OGN21118.1 MAG: hypothetical protein A2915_03640 [Candidatus Yanofskybacteria bacterium RIFCSPLOWO2_01_FULL_41_34]
MAPQQSNNQITLIVALIIVLGFAVGYLYYSQWAVPARVSIEPPVVAGRDDLNKFENLKIDFSILDNKKYKALQIFGESPVNPGVTGKKDIFAPI